MDGPFSEQELRHVLAEAIKTNSFTVDQLLGLVTHSRVQPNWYDMVLPPGRTLNSCRAAWNTHLGPPFNISSPPVPSASASTPAAAPVPGPERKRKPGLEAFQPFQTAPPKRRQSGADNLTRIQPKPSPDGSPIIFSTTPTTQQPKKRGRPSKADVERRNADAIARGEVIPPPRTSSLRGPMGGEVSTELSVASGGYGGTVAVAPVIHGQSYQPSVGISSSFQMEPRRDGSSGAEATEKMKRGRPDSRSSKEPPAGDSSSSVPHQPPGQPESSQTSGTAPTRGPPQTPVPIKPVPETQQPRTRTPVPPPGPDLVSPDTGTSQRSDI